MEIVDAQVHVWPSESEGRPWNDESRQYVQRTAGMSSARRGSFSGAQLIEEMRQAGVSRAVLVPPVFAGDDNTVALTAAAEYPARFAVMGRIAIDHHHSSSERLRSWMDERGMRGVRLTFFYERHARWLFDGTADWVWPVLEQLGIPTAVFAPGLTPAIATIAERHPQLRLVVDHFGIPLDVRDADIRPYVDQLVVLARFDHVCVKASALPGYVTGPYPFAVLHPEIQRVVEAFGPQRVFWGSEMTRLPQPYVQCVELFTEALGFLSASELEWVMGRGISEWLGWLPDRSAVAVANERSVRRV